MCVWLIPLLNLGVIWEQAAAEDDCRERAGTGRKGARRSEASDTHEGCKVAGEATAAAAEEEGEETDEGEDAGWRGWQERQDQEKADVRRLG
jgi:hypothetical protein